MERTYRTTVRPVVQIVLEEGQESWGAYVPGLPTCVAVGATREETERLIEEGIALLIAEMAKDEDAEDKRHATGAAP